MGLNLQVWIIAPQECEVGSWPCHSLPLIYRSQSCRSPPTTLQEVALRAINFYTLKDIL
ncbi:hypothetical protein T36_1156 [Helicobacter cinaedi]|uniref:hypothetical protein n=1 Tax=Helicobacter cinaedi TaxID=213 RepID=UPI001F3A5565|nr:hypothetical protein [Helicobacter cinaedi]BDB64699.1 hypothetical protein T36_1156 [Helicobacter cinaedi]